ncbi:ABC transporter permease [Clostridium thermosuccinogenes]|uniref:ABC transporter permease n=1 Tax=Clostridium thermosuccinogenes TaxID=84032 RepID=A0A2K2FI90_9CLOT|nr:sugar ABC transporter permease [Pseudoclostridium thermosuccinogenes]AUS97089.1 ABC transporter permease [Pseudoclostridium thermosuccinogenes]PNT96699.1 ABC transporter permease [Pseudoclostridium thermosuccinogenes]PNT98493.1 ABC transporter permease [Pseudoclostridium thermosuccinogenes]
MLKNKIFIPIFILPTILLFGVVYAASLLILLGSSFTDWSIGSKVSFIGLSNYIKIITDDDDFRRSLINTIIWVILQSTVHVAIGVIFALILARKEFYWKFARTAFMVPNIISGAAMGMLFLCILNPEFGAVNNLIRLIGYKGFSQNWFMDYRTSFLSVTMTWLPYAAVITLLVLAEIASMPESIFESARMDGASEFKTNLYIVIPMLRNIMGTCVIVAGTSMVQKLDIIMMTTGGGPGNITMNLPVYIYKSALMDNNFGYANTLGVFLIGIGILFVLAVRKIFKLGTSEM